MKASARGAEGGAEEGFYEGAEAGEEEDMVSPSELSYHPDEEVGAELEASMTIGADAAGGAVAAQAQVAPSRPPAT